MSYSEQLRKLADQFFEAHQESGSARQILRWAYDNKLWEPHPDDFIRAGAEQLARAMRDDTETDPQGRTVRKKHYVLVERNGEQIEIRLRMLRGYISQRVLQYFHHMPQHAMLLLDRFDD